MSTPTRIIHFVTGGGSGATRVAIDLACSHLATGRFLPLLILRRKRQPLPAGMQQRIAAAGLRTAWVDAGPKWKTRAQLRREIADFRPAVFAAHGFSEHIWGRQAALAAQVPVVVHIEQNCERYAFWRRWQARPLAARTQATVCVSQGVADHVRALRLESPRVEIIHNAVDVTRFAAGAGTFEARSPDIVMAARFARQKDHGTLLRAVQMLVAAGWTGRLHLLGGGKASHRRQAEKTARALGIAARVEFAGLVDRPELRLQQCRVAVLSTRHEGLPLVLIEAMAAGCAVIASDAPGVADIIQDGRNGWTFPIGDHAALAILLQRALAGGPAVESVVATGRSDAPSRFALPRMTAAYENLFGELLRAANPAS